MPDYRTLFDSEFLYAFHLQGREVTVEVARVTGGEVTGTGGKKSRKPLAYFKGKDKPLALNKTNCKAIAAMYGTDTAKWLGKRVTIYPTTTSFGNETVDCVRVRPGIPKGKDNSADLDENTLPPDDSREPGAEG
jgi:hypothetical protein